MALLCQKSACEIVSFSFMRQAVPRFALSPVFSRRRRHASRALRAILLAARLLAFSVAFMVS